MNKYTYPDSPYVSVKEAREALGEFIPCSSFYRYIKNKQIPSIRIGGRIYIPTSWLEAIIRKYL